MIARASGIREATAAALHVLVVEDDPDLVEVLETLLEQSGYLVSVARCGVDAITLARTFLPDVALIDIGLPDMTGFEVASQLQSLLAPDTCSFVALTAYPADEIRAKANEALFQVVLTKPCSFADIDAALRDAVDYPQG